jgi:hypothetical protein
METKYRRGIFLAFGITFALIVAMIVVWKLKFYDDVTQQLTTTQASYEAAKTTGATLDTELKAASIAKANLVLAQDELDYFRRRFRSLNFDLTATPGEGPRNRTWLGYMNEYFSDYGLEMRRQLVRAADETGVVLDTSLKVDAPPQVPENVVAPPSGFLKPVTGGSLTVTVAGDLGSILRFLERVNRSPILMTVGAIKLEGASPAIKATFTITPYLVGTGPSIQLPAAAPAAAATNPDGSPVVPGEEAPGAAPAVP